MSVTERFQDTGQFSIPIKPSAHPVRQVLDSLQPFGHVIVLPQRVKHPAMFAESTLLAAAKYAGPLLEIDTERGLQLRGQGMVWWLGDQEGKGQIKNGSVSGTLSAALAAALPLAVTSGSVVNTGLANYSGSANREPAIDIIRTIMQTLKAVFRVNPDATIDAGPNNSNGPFSLTPQLVAVRNGWGYDPTYTAVEADLTLYRMDANGWASAAVMMNEDAKTGALTPSGTATRGSTYYDMRGNLVDRTFRVIRSDTASIGDYLEQELNQRTISKELEMDTLQWELVGGRLSVGDTIYVWDPPKIVGDARIRFRGKYINPDTLRIWEADWPVTEGHGVYYRPNYTSTITSADWVDLTPYVDWERDTPTRLLCGWALPTV